MKTITERDGKNVNMQVVGDLHKYPDGSVHTVKEGKAVWEEGSGGDSGGSGGGAVYAIFTEDEDEGTWACDKTYTELKAAYDSGCVIIGKIDGENVPFILINYDGKEGAEFGGSSTRYQTLTRRLFYYRAYIQELNNTAFAEYGSVSVSSVNSSI